MSLVEIAKNAAEDVLDLLSSQIKVTRAELAFDARAVAGRAVQVGMFVPVLLAGYLFGLAAIAFALSGIWGWTTAIATAAGLLRRRADSDMVAKPAARILSSTERMDG